jgi:hypothetical protein
MLITNSFVGIAMVDQVRAITEVKQKLARKRQLLAFKGHLSPRLSPATTAGGRRLRAASSASSFLSAGKFSLGTTRREPIFGASASTQSPAR